MLSNGCPVDVGVLNVQGAACKVLGDSGVGIAIAFRGCVLSFVSLMMVEPFLVDVDGRPCDSADIANAFSSSLLRPEDEISGYAAIRYNNPFICSEIVEPSV